MDINVKNVSALIHFMDGLSDPNFTMRQFVHDCDTPACALGWSCTVPELKAAGADIRTLSGGDVLAMSRKVFGYDAYGNLFAGSWHGHLTTPRQWADHARAFLKSCGYEVAPRTQAQIDHFAAFMGRVLKPVDLGAVHRV